MKENKKFLQTFAVLALIVAVLGISVGFAAMSQTLNVTGQAKVQPANWDVEFTNAVFSDNGTNATATTDSTSNPQKPTLNATTFSNYEIVLKQPGDKGTYTLTVSNLGDIDAELTSVTLGNNLTIEGSAQDAAVKAKDEQIVQNNIVYTVKWANGDEIVTGSDLLAGSTGNTRDLVITVEYNENATELPSAPVTITGKDLTLVYTQK